MRTLVSTFGQGDEEKVRLAMRSLSYDRLVLLGEPGAEDSQSFAAIERLEEMVGNKLLLVTVGQEGGGFMGLVEEISEVLMRYSHPKTKGGVIILNISGGSKLLGDAALFAAFRHGVEAYHCDGNTVVRLPVLKGATAKDRFTEDQASLISCLSEGPRLMDDAMTILKPTSRQSLERVVRELRKAGIVDARLVEGKVVLSITEPGSEVAKVLDAAKKETGSVP